MDFQPATKPLAIKLPWLEKDCTQGPPPRLGGPFPARLIESAILVPNKGPQHPVLWRITWQRLDLVDEDGTPVQYKCVLGLLRANGAPFWPNCDAHLMASAFQKLTGLSGLPASDEAEPLLSHVFFVTYHVRRRALPGGGEYRQHLFIPTGYLGQDYTLPHPPRVRRSTPAGYVRDTPQVRRAAQPAATQGPQTPDRKETGDLAATLADELDGLSLKQLEDGEGRRRVHNHPKLRNQRIYNIPVSGGLTVIARGGDRHWPVLVRVLMERGLLEAHGETIRRRTPDG